MPVKTPVLQKVLNWLAASQCQRIDDPTSSLTEKLAQCRLFAGDPRTKFNAFLLTTTSTTSFAHQIDHDDGHTQASKLS